MKFAFSLSTVVEANSEEDALNIVSWHISTVARHVASERPLADCGAKFTLSKVDDAAEAADLKRDVVTEKHGPVPLNLDPESPEGIAHAEQLAATADAEAIPENAEA
jgi:hypothetical protein